MRWSRKLDLTIGIALGLVLGLVVTYLLVVVFVNSGKDTSTISTPQSKESRTAPGEGAHP
jgi:hypothetical protein